jgi:hypothetical protein
VRVEAAFVESTTLARWAPVRGRGNIHPGDQWNLDDAGCGVGIQGE